MSPALMCTRCCLCAFHVEFLFIPTMTLRDRWCHPPLRAVEMKLRELSELAWGHTASEVWPDLPKSRAPGFWSSLVGTGKTWGLGFQLQA